MTQQELNKAKTTILEAILLNPGETTYESADMRLRLYADKECMEEHLRAERSIEDVYISYTYHNVSVTLYSEGYRGNTYTPLLDEVLLICEQLIAEQRITNG